MFQITYSTVALRDALGDAVGTLAEVITQPMLRYWEVNEEKVGGAMLVFPGGLSPHAVSVCIAEFVLW
jgi:hypothetical protein